MTRPLRRRFDASRYGGSGSAVARRLRMRCGVTPVEPLCGDLYGSTLDACDACGRALAASAYGSAMARRLRKRSGYGDACARRYGSVETPDDCGSALTRRLRTRCGATPAEALWSDAC